MWETSASQALGEAIIITNMLPVIEPWQLEDALACYYETALGEARRRLLAGEPPLRFFEPASRGE